MQYNHYFTISWDQNKIEYANILILNTASSHKLNKINMYYVYECTLSILNSYLMSKRRGQYPVTCYFGKKGKKLSFVSKWVTVVASERIYRSMLTKSFTQVLRCKISVEFIIGQNRVNRFKWRSF